MRIAIISDIHEDFETLEKAFRKICTAGYDLLVCLGDITGFAQLYYSHRPDANACLDLLREYAHIALTGNHDLFTTRRLPSYHSQKFMPENWYDLSLEQQFLLTGNKIWLYEDEVRPNLSQQNLEYLQSLPEWEIFDAGIRKILFSHYIKPDLTGVGRWFPWQAGELRYHFRLMEELNCSLAFTGHFHPEGLNLVSRHLWSAPGYSKTAVNIRPKIALSPAIVNNCKTTPGFLIYDPDTSIITPYPIN